MRSSNKIFYCLIVSNVCISSCNFAVSILKSMMELKLNVCADDFLQVEQYH